MTVSSTFTQQRSADGFASSSRIDMSFAVPIQAEWRLPQPGTITNTGIQLELSQPHSSISR